MNVIIDRFWHRALRRPYRAVCRIDTGSGPPVVLLHGLGRSSESWGDVVGFLKDTHRVLAFDLVGFGKSPKPDWIDYNADDHARAIITALRRQRVNEPIVLAGHSMGCLVAVRVARLKPQLIERLVLYEMPLYTEVPALKRYTLLRRMYLRLYHQVLKYPDYSPENVRVVQKMASRIGGFDLNRRNWVPYVRSLRNTIIRQRTAEDMRRLTIPMDLIYGSLDMLILRGNVETIFDLEVSKITTHTVRSRHKITLRASAFIAKRIDENVELPVKKKISNQIAHMNLGL
jgi:cis-3-alkyl-4-acyloxetan-2-one decarboxylase